MRYAKIVDEEIVAVISAVVARISGGKLIAIQACSSVAKWRDRALRVSTSRRARVTAKGK